MVISKKNGRFVDEDIVISGMSGRFPDCNSISEFQDKLFQGIDLVKEDDSRWPIGYLDTYSGMGLIKDLKKFDAAFFGAHPKLAERTDPIVRVLLKTSFEAIVDAGISPKELRGTETAVVVGVSSNEAADWWSADPDRVNGYEFLGCTRTMYSNRISFVFDLRGPSYTMDSQSSSSLVGIQQGYYMLKNGMVDAVIVAATNLVLNPHFNIMFKKLNLLSPDGKCKIFDANADGYGRSEAGVALIMQRKSDARRIYATVVGTGTNCDGYKEEGCQVISQRSQIDLYKEVNSKCNINPSEITYFETHGYGTVEGDATEVNGIVEIFCNNRNSPLLIGCVKSNMGHSEPAGGLVAVVKALMIFENNIIPPNIHYNTPNPNIPALKNGQIEVVNKLTSWNGGLIGINSFGIGGTNSYLVLKPNMKEKMSLNSITIPRLLCISGRNDTCATSFLNKVKKYYKDNELCALLYKIFSYSIPHYNSRMFSVIGDEIFEEITSYTPVKRQVCFVFSGMGSQWAGMGKNLLNIDIFRCSIEQCAAILKKENFNLYNVILTEDNSIFEDVLNSFVGITCIQIALVDVLKSLEIVPDFIVGHSIGELACAYADNTLSLEQTVLATYWRGKCIQESDIPKGSMAAVGLSANSIINHNVPEDLFIACHNSSDSITISGPPESIRKFTKVLQSEGIFAKEVNSSGIAFHSKYIAVAGPKFKSTMEQIIKNPKQRSARWISTSVPETEWHSENAQYSSPVYHLNNLLSPVLFQEALMHIPDNSVVIEIAPHALLQPILKGALGSKCTHIGLVRRNQATVTNFLANIGRLYNAGLQPQVEKLYPKIEFPVSRKTPMIQSLVEWDHSEDWFLVTFLTKPACCQGEMEKEIDIKTARYKFLTDAKMDDVTIFPVSGFLWLIWEAVAKFQYTTVENVRLIIENFQILKRCILQREHSSKFEINILENCEECEIREKGVLVARARVKLSENIQLTTSTKLTPSCTDYLPLRTSDAYQDLYAKGYSYNGLFRGILLIDNKVECGRLAWKQNWVTFLDSILQLHLLSLPQQKLYAINHIQKILIDPKKHLELSYFNNNSAGFPVSMNHKLNLIRSGGVEFRGIKSDWVTVRTKHPEPILENYTFVPHITDKVMSYKSAFSILVQLICENVDPNETLKILEIINDASSLSYSQLTSKISELIDREPYCTATFEKYSKTTENLKFGTAEDLSGYHLIVTTDIVSSKIFQNLINSLDFGEYIFTIEHNNFLLTEDEINKLGIKLLLKLPTKDETFLLFRKPPLWKTPMVVMLNLDSFNWIEGVKMALHKHQIDRRQTMLIFHGDDPVGIIGFLRSIRCEQYGTGLRCLLTDKTIYPYKIVDLGYIDYFRKGLAFNVYKNGEWGSYRRLPIEEELTVEVEHAYIGNTVPGDLSSLKYIENNIPFVKNLEDSSSELCYVYYASIYAQDIRCLSGATLYDDPSQIYEQGCVLGHEYSGRDSKGRRIFGMIGSGALATTVLGHKSFMWEVPNHWSLLEASTVPRVYCNAYYALLLRANLKQNETVYINAGISGMVIACIRIGLGIAANVLVGCNNESEKNYLKTLFPKIAEKNYINLEKGHFEYQILQATDGKGVNVIFDTMNCQKRNSFITSLSTNGRLVEFEKNSSFNESLGIAATGKNLIFHKISQLTIWKSDSNKGTRENIYQLLNGGIISGVVQPIFPTHVYNDKEVQDAFKLAKSGKFSGKIVIKFRDEEPQKTVIPATKLVSAEPSGFMDSDMSCIVTGGLTFIGIQLINWLITRGVKKFVIATTYKPTTGYQHLMLRRWKDMQATVVIFNGDITTESGVENLIKKAISLGMVSGIFHVAKIACETAIENATLNHFELPYRTKVLTAKCLDSVSRKLCPTLKYFVGFSDVSSSHGYKGQSNIAYACSTLEMLFEKRRFEGYPATVIQFGIIDECDEKKCMPNHGGFVAQKISSCLKIMPKLLNVQFTTVSAATVGNKCIQTGVGIFEKLIDEICDILEIENKENVSKFTMQELGIEPASMEEIRKLFIFYNINVSKENILKLTFEKIRSYPQL